MRKVKWATVFTAALLVAACDGQGSEAATPDATGEPVTPPAAPSEAAPSPATADSDVTPTPTPKPPNAEYENSRPPLDNSGAQPTEGSCLAELGREKAEALSQQCYEMSPATRPPCNIQNSCERIRKELKRGCEFGDTSDNPAYCSEV
ncbi:hypothetical protein [Citromicrobium bathyomarinum]|uniref:hypothetical protein n=1 Tax=Citromicrobium bathyomarinum TaxID=72174 RepID=UPI00315A8428